MSNTLEPVIVCLVGNLEGEPHLGITAAQLASPKADGLNGVEALLVLYLRALLHAGGGAERVGGRVAHGLVPGDLNLLEDGAGVLDGGAVRTRPDGDGHRVGDHLQDAVLDGHLPAVLVAGPDLLALLVDDPVCAAVLPGNVAAHGGLVVLDEGLFSALDAVLGDKGVADGLIIVVERGEWCGGAVGVPNHLALGYRDGNTGRALLRGTGLRGPVGADLSGGDVVLDLAVLGDINAVVLVAVVLVVSAGESRHQD